MSILTIKIENKAIRINGSKYLWYIVYCGLFKIISKNNKIFKTFSLINATTKSIEKKHIKKNRKLFWNKKYDILKKIPPPL